MERCADYVAEGDGSSGAVSTRKSRQRSWEVDVQRARALRGDALEELTESQREWVWRSLLRGVRLAQATKLAQLAPEETPQALQRLGALEQEAEEKGGVHQMPADHFAKVYKVSVAMPIAA